MKKRVSVIFAYRNRELMRVKRCLDSLLNQTFKDFEVIFIDYGSSDSYAKEIMPLVKSYSFAKYYYSHTVGYPWNRSNALNTGIRLSDSEYILFGDIDLIYSPNVVRELVQKARKDSVVFTSIYYLSKSFNKWDCLLHINTSLFNDSGDEPIGAVYFIHKEILYDIQGFDEYYALWGVEDRDLHHRVKSLGISSIRVDARKCPIYHQWHPIVSDRKKNFFPEKWWDDMNIHYAINEHIVKRNQGDWGKLIEKSDRPVLQAKEVVFDILFDYAKSYQKPELYSRILESLSQLNPNECLKIEIRQNNTPNIFLHFIHYLNMFFRIIRFPLGIDYIMNVEREKFFYPQLDIIYTIWQLIKKYRIIKDYYIQNEANKISIKLMIKEEYTLNENNIQ
jgi:glycosyltransferase involved in cell wall biosynthesis